MWVTSLRTTPTVSSNSPLQLKFFVLSLDCICSPPDTTNTFHNDFSEPSRCGTITKIIGFTAGGALSP